MRKLSEVVPHVRSIGKDVGSKGGGRERGGGGRYPQSKVSRVLPLLAGIKTTYLCPRISNSFPHRI